MDKEKKNTVKALENQKIYVGPTIRGVVDKNTIFSDKLPTEVEKLKKELPIFGNLFVPVISAPKAQMMIKNKNGYAYTAYQETLKFLKRGE